MPGRPLARSRRPPPVPRRLARLIVVGMARQSYDLQLTRYGEEGWRATFYPAGRGHSVTSAVGSGGSRELWSGWSRPPERVSIAGRCLMDSIRGYSPRATWCISRCPSGKLPRGAGLAVIGSCLHRVIRWIRVGLSSQLVIPWARLFPHELRGSSRKFHNVFHRHRGNGGHLQGSRLHGFPRTLAWSRQVPSRLA